MDIKIIKVGFLETNCYILKKDNNILIIDPGDEAEKIINNIDGNVIGIIITHYHFDHIGSLQELREKYNCNVYDYHNLIEGENVIDNYNFEMIKSPGHKEDLISILIDNDLFCGDFIFDGSIGRCDLHGGDFKEMQESINKILKLNLDTNIYPGHGNKTTLRKEKNNLISYL